MKASSSTHALLAMTVALGVAPASRLFRGPAHDLKTHPPGQSPTGFRFTRRRGGSGYCHEPKNARGKGPKRSDTTCGPSAAPFGNGSLSCVRQQAGQLVSVPRLLGRAFLIRAEGPGLTARRWANLRRNRSLHATRNDARVACIPNMDCNNFRLGE